MAPAFVAAENIPRAPRSNVFYEHLWYSENAGGYLDPAKKLYQQFSPYSTAMVNVKGTCGLSIANVYTLTATKTLTDANKQLIENFFKFVYKDTTKLSYGFYAEGGVMNECYLVPNSTNMQITWDYLGNNQYTFLMYQPFTAYFDFDVPAGSFSFVDSSVSSSDDTLIIVSIGNIAGDCTLDLISDLRLKEIRYWPYNKLLDVTYTFPTNIITNKLVFSFRYYANNGQKQLFTLRTNVSLDNYSLGTYSFWSEGVIESTFDYPLNTNSVHYTLQLDGTDNKLEPYDLPYPLYDWKYNFYICKLVPISTYETYGGDIYGSWQSRSCEAFDFVCHLGNCIGYLIYEFPLTSSITKLITPIGEFFIKSFNFLEGFESIGVAYGVIFSMIIISVIMFLIFGK
ncbi:MAG: hypothetical protein ACI4M5_06170 [Christensenellales bacterium]